MGRNLFRNLLNPLLAAGLLLAPVAAQADSFEKAFDSALGTDKRAPKAVAPVAPQPRTTNRYAVPLVAFTPRNAFEAQVAALTRPDLGRIGVAAIDLDTGRTLNIMGDQPFPMASTSKIAIAATFLDMVDQGKFRLDQSFPLMVPVASRKFDGPVAPVRAGTYLPAITLIERMITRSDNSATDALLATVGGPQAVNRWLRRSGIEGARIDRDIATLVRDDGEVNPATTIDPRDSTTPRAMARLLTGLHDGKWLSPASRSVLFGAMERCLTGKHRIVAQLPSDVTVLHKTGTLNNTSSDVGFIRTPDGRTIVLAIYVTGQGGKPARDARIATIARTLYDGFSNERYAAGANAVSR